MYFICILFILNYIWIILNIFFWNFVNWIAKNFTLYIGYSAFKLYALTKTIKLCIIKYLCILDHTVHIKANNRQAGHRNPVYICCCSQHLCCDNTNVLLWQLLWSVWTVCMPAFQNRKILTRQVHLSVSLTAKNVHF